MLELTQQGQLLQGRRLVGQIFRPADHALVLANQSLLQEIIEGLEEFLFLTRSEGCLLCGGDEECEADCALREIDLALGRAKRLLQQGIESHVQ